MARGMAFADLAFLGRVGNQFSPLSFGGLEAWLKADSFSLPDGNQVGGVGNHWIDQTGNGHDGQNHTGLNLPSYETNEIGSMPLIRFAPGANAFLTLVTAISLSGDFTVMITMKKQSGTNDTLVFGHNVNNHQLRRWRSGVNNASFFAGGSEQISSNFASANTSLHVATYRRSGTSVSFRENKTARGSGTDSNTLTLNTIVNNLFLGTGDMDIAEILVYNQHRSDSEVDNLYDNYLKLRWTTLP